MQARAAAAARWGLPNADEARRDYAARRVEDYISRTLAEAPPLTDDQVSRLAGLLRAGQGAA